MSISQRRHIRLTLDIPAFRYTKTGEKIGIIMYQISIGGCLIEWDDSIEQNDEFRMEIQLPDGNWLPVTAKALYLVKDDGIGVQFQDITQFEQELIVDVMSENLAEEGIPLKVDPFSQPKTFLNEETNTSEINYNINEDVPEEELVGVT